MTTTKIKCVCGYQLGCKAWIEIRDDRMWVYDYQKELAASILLPPPVAEAIRAAVKAMEDER